MKIKGAESDLFIKSNPCFIPVSVSFFLVINYNFNRHKYGLEDTGKGEEKRGDPKGIALFIFFIFGVFVAVYVRIRLGYF